MKKVKAVIMADNPEFVSGDVIEYVYGPKRIQQLNLMTELYPERISSQNLDLHLPNLKDIEVIFSSWGMIKLTNQQLAGMPNLKTVFYAGGSVNNFALPLVEHNIIICSAVEANAVPVAEFCLAHILLSCKNYLTNTRNCRLGPWNKDDKRALGGGVYGETIAILGVGAISRYLLKLLAPFKLRAIAVSNYLTKYPVQKVKALGIDKLVSIDKAFKEAYVISNHLPDKANNKNVITKEHFASMRHGAVFINTGRGAQVDEAGMIEILKIRPDITVVLDVQYPEPPSEDSELYSLPNVYLSSHIAGSLNDEVHRMADYMIEDFERWQAGEALQYGVNAEELTARA